MLPVMASKKPAKSDRSGLVTNQIAKAAPEEPPQDKRFDVFLREFARMPIRTEAMKTAGLEPEELSERLRHDSNFSRRYLEVCEMGYDVLEDAAVSRAVKGWDEPVFDMRRGIEVGYVRRYSDSLLLALLKANRKKFRGDDAGGGRGVSEEARRNMNMIFDEAKALAVEVGPPR